MLRAGPPEQFVGTTVRSKLLGIATQRFKLRRPVVILDVIGVIRDGVDQPIGGEIALRTDAAQQKFHNERSMNQADFATAPLPAFR